MLRFEAIGEEIERLLTTTTTATAEQPKKSAEKTFVPEPVVASSSQSSATIVSSGFKRKAMDAYIESEDRVFFEDQGDDVVRKNHLVDALASVWRALVLRPADEGCKVAKARLEACITDA